MIEGPEAGGHLGFSRKQLEEKMDRWVYLNDLAEQIEAQKNNG